MIKKMYVAPGDLVIVHVIKNKELPKNHKEWHFSEIRPFKFSFTPEDGGITFNDPQLDIGMRVGTEPRRRIN